MVVIVVVVVVLGMGVAVVAYNDFNSSIMQFST
jgi:hypothetical protein